MARKIDTLVSGCIWAFVIALIVDHPFGGDTAPRGRYRSISSIVAGASASCYCDRPGPVAELVYAGDLKSPAQTGLRVRVPSGPPALGTTPTYEGDNIFLPERLLHVASNGLKAPSSTGAWCQH